MIHPLVHAAVVLPGHTTQVLLEMTISVILAAMNMTSIIIDSIFSFTQLTLCGMVLDVVITAPAVSSTTLPGSRRPSPNPLQMTWRSGYAAYFIMIIIAY